MSDASTPKRPSAKRASEVIYQIYPSSFKDSNGDGIGDLNGITDMLKTYLKSDEPGKGIKADAIWISPFYLCPDGPRGDGGYAVSDHRKLDPKFIDYDLKKKPANVTEEDYIQHEGAKQFQKMVEEAHRPTLSHPNGLKVYVDFVLCHTSDESEWFKMSQLANIPEYKRTPEIRKAIQHYTDQGIDIQKYKDYYVWSERPKDDHGNPVFGDPSNWRSVFPVGDDPSPSAWKWVPECEKFYLHHFAASQPALNLNRADVQQERLDEMEFWLDKGVDGLRIDAIPFANHNANRDANGNLYNNPGNDKVWKEQTFEHSMCQPQTYNELVPKIRALCHKAKYKTPKTTTMAEFTPKNTTLNATPEDTTTEPTTKKTTLGEIIAGKKGGGEALEEAKKYLINPQTGAPGLDSAYTNGSFLTLWDTFPSAEKVRNMIGDVIHHFPDNNHCSSFNCHDFDRLINRITQNVNIAYRDPINKQFLALAVTMPGDLCIYQGDELGLPQAEEKDLQGKILGVNKEDKRPLCRTGFPSDSTKPNAGFSDAKDPHIPVAEGHWAYAADLQEAESRSMLKFTRRILEQRAENPALLLGTTELVKTWEKNEGGVVAFTRKTNDQTVLCTFNMSGKEKVFTPAKYFDDATLEKLGVTRSTVVHLRPYGTSFHGLNPHPPTQTHETGLRATSFRANTEAKENTGESKSIFALDMLIADQHIDETDVPSSFSHIQRKHAHFHHGDKATLDKQEFESFELESRRNRREPPTLTAGGSTSTSMMMLKGFLGTGVNVNLMGVAGNDAHGHVIKDFLEQGGIRLVPPQKDWPEGIETSISQIIHHAGVKSSVLTYTGNEISKLHEMIDQPKHRRLLEANIRDNDIVYMPESTTSKFGIGMRNRILESRYRNHKELVLVLPTRADFGPNDTDFKDIISSCNVVMGEGIEFCRAFGKNIVPPQDPEAPRVNDETMWDVARQIQAEFKKEILKRDGIPCSKFGQVAFINRGHNRPALIVTKDEITQIPLHSVPANNTLGGGHATFAGFLAGYLKGLNHVDSAKLAVAVAAEKIQQETPEPYLTAPKESLKRALLRNECAGCRSAFADSTRPPGDDASQGASSAPPRTGNATGR